MPLRFGDNSFYPHLSAARKAGIEPLIKEHIGAGIVNGATRFVIALQLSGGGGVDGWSSEPVNLA